jgi:hypothetical protein
MLNDTTEGAGAKGADEEQAANHFDNASVSPQTSVDLHPAKQVQATS